ncbi:MAG: glycosyltransferase, partial [Armatimonadetes bacterium]|nr:glycosyltransferase [Armatimonadota bacterium]
AREAARLICEKYGVKCVQRTNRRGYKAGAINDFLPSIESPYIAIFDADALPTAPFLRECVPQIHENPKLGFLQTPQFYANTEVSYVALASARQQNVFYEYICEGKSYSRAAFCCGTNVIFRRKALVDSGGFDEENVTEDFATSFNMHFRGWDSLYLNRTYVYSLAPENLAAYFTQQSRWSFGTLGTSRHFIKSFLRNPRALSAGQWWEYFLSATYYWVGWVNFFFILLPLLYLFFNIKPLRQDVLTYLLVFLPYMLFTLNMFYTGMASRGYKMGETVLGQQIGFISFPIHMSSAVAGVLGQKRPFGVTPKGVGGRIPWQALWPQLGLLALSGIAFVLGMYRYFAGLDRNTTAVVINSMWALYHVWMLSSVLRLNTPVREGAEKWFFGDAENPKNGVPLLPLERPRNPFTVVRVGGVVALICLSVAAFVSWKVAAWNAAPVYPVNVAIVDRTLGPNAQQHRALSWTLNYLKVRKEPKFAAGDGRRNYDVGLDYFGFVPNPNAPLRPDVIGGGDLVATGYDIPLPGRLTTPGALYLADTYGEWVAFDANRRRYVRSRAARRGLSVEEIDAVENFARRGGLVMGEWNTLGYPTRPGDFLPPPQLEAAIDAQRRRALRLQAQTLPAARARVGAAEASGDYRRISIARGRLEDARGALVDADAKRRALQALVIPNTARARQGAAAERLEKLLHVSYQGWYGRYVENFAQEKEYDFRLWKNVRDSLTRRNGGKETEPEGAGFVFYPDGPSQVFDPATSTFEPSPFAHPVVILGDELGAALTGELAVIETSRDAQIAADPLLRGVRTSVPARNWFEVVTAQGGGRVLANYRLAITPAAGARLQKAGFPSRYISSDGQSLVFPAAIAGRDNDTTSGALRSLYLAGDASGYATISPLATRFPALGGVEASWSGRFGSFPAQYFWGFYQPMLRNVFENTPRLRYNEAG